MDEPTASMDNSTEESFKRRFTEILENKTLILITQKGSLLSLVDRLIIMENQTIVADGPKEQVMEALKKGRIKV
jgi:ATP-binding cassette subfamily C protein LapB